LVQRILVEKLLIGRQERFMEIGLMIIIIITIIFIILIIITIIFIIIVTINIIFIIIIMFLYSCVAARVVIIY